MFITLEDETGIANLVIWPKVFEQHRRTILGAPMFSVRGRIQREGEVVHLVAYQITDMSAELASVGKRGNSSRASDGRVDRFHAGSPPPDPRVTGLAARDIYIADLHIDRLRVKPRDFR